MTNSLEGLENIKAKNTERLAEEDRQFCERLQSLYTNVLGHYRKMYSTLQAMADGERDFYGSISDSKAYGEHEYTILSHTFFRICKRGFSETIEIAHNIFIRLLNQYFVEKYRITPADKNFSDYAKLVKPESPCGPFNYLSSRAPEETMREKEPGNYEKSLGSYYDSIINAGLHYGSVVDDIFRSDAVAGKK